MGRRAAASDEVYSANTLHCPVVTAPLPRLANSQPSHSLPQCFRSVTLRPPRPLRQHTRPSETSRTHATARKHSTHTLLPLGPGSWRRVGAALYIEYISSNWKGGALMGGGVDN